MASIGIINAGPLDEDIGETGADLFRDSGALIIRGLIDADELQALQSESMALIKQAMHATLEDTKFKTHTRTGETVPFRIEYLVAKSRAAQRLLGHPYVLNSMVRLLGEDLVPTWDSMVFKQDGRGAVIPWHRDQRMGTVLDAPIAVNVDFYLDDATLENCLWAIPGSQGWSDAETDAFVEARTGGSFSLEGAEPIPMQAGDVLLHDVFVLHGSPETQSALRRVIYYEFRSASGIEKWGPHTGEYSRLKKDVLQFCQSLRRQGEAISTAPQLRIPHEDHWRDNTAFVPGHL